MKNTNNTLAATQLTQVIEQLNRLSTDELVNLYIEYASDNSYENIYNLDENTINELYDSPWQALYDSNHKDFNDRDCFFTYNGNGHMVSFSNEDDSNCPIDISELAQWLINEDKLSEYHISVTTLEDMLASIEDNITDDENMLHSLMDYLNIGYDKEKVSLLGADYETSLIDETIDFISGYDYNQLSDIINHLGINYQ